jgi:hypothetical protein
LKLLKNKQVLFLCTFDACRFITDFSGVEVVYFTRHNSSRMHDPRRDLRSARMARLSSFCLIAELTAHAPRLPIAFQLSAAL